MKNQEPVEIGDLNKNQDIAVFRPTEALDQSPCILGVSKITLKNMSHVSQT